MSFSHPTRSDLLEAHKRVRPFVHRTPIFTSSLIDELASCELFFKTENFQRMGAFKMRGAIHAILQLSQDQREKGVVTHSSGNFGQAVALAAKTLKVKAHIVMPENAPAVKKAAVKSYGGIITECTSTIEARSTAAEKVMQETGAHFLHPSNDLDVILGNATAGIELLESHSDLDMIFTPVGGGGLLAGISLAAHHFGNNCQTWGGEPSQVDDAYRSLQLGSIQYNESTNTIADGLRTHLGDINFPIIQSFVTEIVRVEEQEILHAMRLIWERLKIVVEPSSAVPLAAVLQQSSKFQNKRIGILLSGGNVDLENLPF
jgi:threonine dehydratase